MAGEMNEMDCELKEMKWNIINKEGTNGNEMKHDKGSW